MAGYDKKLINVREQPIIEIFPERYCNLFVNWGADARTFL